MLNSYLDGNEVVLLDEINIGLAVAIEDALIVPVIKDVGDKDMFQIASGRRCLGRKGQKGRTFRRRCHRRHLYDNKPWHVWDEGLHAHNKSPQCAILGVGEMKDKPCVCGEEIVIKPMTLSLTFDHRIVDGAQAALFLRQLKEMIENPSCF